MRTVNASSYVSSEEPSRSAPLRALRTKRPHSWRVLQPSVDLSDVNLPSTASMIHSAIAPTEQAYFSIARCQGMLSLAFSLVYHNYLDAGLVEPNPAQVRVLPQHALSSTE